MSATRKISASALQLLFEVSLGLALVVVNIVRIFRIPITIDETGYHRQYTYLDLVLEKEGHANNHIFHSLLRKTFAELFTDSLFFLRLDSLLAQIVFLVYSWLLSRLLFRNRWWQLCLFVLLNAGSPFLYEFWGLSRGYGLSLTCMLVSVYYLFRYQEDKKLRLLCYSFIGGILAVYSNFSLLNFYVGLAGVVVVTPLLFKRVEGIGLARKEYAVLFAATATLALLITGPLIHIYHFGELSFMGNTGFMEDTVQSLAFNGILQRVPDRHLALKVTSYFVVIYGVIASLCWVGKSLRLRIKKEVAPGETMRGTLLVLLLVIPAIAIIAQHAFFKINYVTDRAALFFIPLVLLSLVYTLSSFRKPWAYVSGVGGIALVAWLTYIFWSAINVSHTLLWWFNVDDMHVLRRIEKETAGNPRKLKLCVFWAFGPSFYYDIHHYYPDKYEVLNWDRMPVLGSDTTYDYYYVVNSDNADTLKLHYHLDSGFVGNSFLLYRKN